jgi:hypothetical protein
MFNLFGQNKNSPGYNKYTQSETIDYLIKIRDYFGIIGYGCLENKKSHCDVLVAFSYSSAALASTYLINDVPETLQRIGYIFDHLRAFYDCEWQSFMLHKFRSDSDRDKLRIMWTHVDWRNKLYESELIKENNLFSECISKTPNRNITNDSLECIKEYIHGTRKYSVKKDDFQIENIDALTSYIIDLSKTSKSNRNLIFTRMLKVYETNPSNIFLNQFDFIGNTDRKLPDSWLKKI